jgi:hypothetical protein
MPRAGVQITPDFVLVVAESGEFSPRIEKFPDAALAAGPLRLGLPALESALRFGVERRL